MVDARQRPGMLLVICGRAGAGKTTLARRLGVERDAILICEDQWLLRLFDGASSLHEYVERRGRIRRLLAEHVPSMLAGGHSVVCDFGGNTIQDRSWSRAIADSARAPMELHYIVADSETCIARIAQRNRTRPDGVYWGDVSEELFHAVDRYFQPPGADEGLTVIEH
jgi:predicted kinase